MIDEKDGACLFLVLARDYFGRGRTMTKALTELRRAGASRKQGLILAYLFPKVTEHQKDDVQVTGLGDMTWPAGMEDPYKFRLEHITLPT